MKDQIRFSIVTTSQVTLMCLVSIVLYLATDVILSGDYSYYIAINPFTSGLLHANFNHLLSNIFIIFITLNMRCNRFYTVEKIFWVTSLIAILYLPIIIIEPEFSAIGISGTCYFLLMRGLGSTRKVKILAYFLIAVILTSEFLKLGNNDRIAHAVHIIGSILGLISLYPYGLKFINEKIYEIIS
jgi:membrane associated rhomboid family serine protease